MNQLTKLAVVFGGGAVLFAVLKGVVFKEATTAKPENDARKDAAATEQKDAAVALKAYRAALSAGEDSEAMADLNRELIKEYGLRVLRRKKDKKLVVLNAAGDEVLEAA